VIVAPVLVRALTATFDMTGVPEVVNVLFAEVTEVPLAFTDTTSKSYSVPPVNPVNVTEWLVTSAGLTVVEVP
jgi:hypothetical protein